MQGLPVLQVDVPVLRSSARDIGLVILASVLLGACTSHRGVVEPTGSSGTSRAGASGMSEDIAGQLMSREDLSRLSALAAKRASAEAAVDYRIGPDDLVEVHVPDLGDTRTASVPSSASRVDTGQAVAPAPSADRGFRVSQRGTIEIPLLGEIAVEGLTEAELATEIGRQLVKRGILLKPEVSVEIVEFRGRAVTIVGSVTKPGTYPLTKTGATLVDMILVAGGPTESAGRIVQFTPAEEAITTGRADAAKSKTRTATAASRSRPIRIDLEVLLRRGPTDPDVNPLARPGDLIRIAEEGTVQVDGWVDKPGAYPATSTTTLTGVLAAASPQYAGDVGAVTVRRTLSPGEQQTFTIDVEDVTQGRTPDFPLTDGDVVTVPMHTGKLIPYSIYQVGKQVIHVGGNIPLF